MAFKKKPAMASDKALHLFKQNGGVMRTSQTQSEGVHSSVLYLLRDSGKIESIGRGIYKIKEMNLKSDPDLIQVFMRTPNVVLCLTSALYFHEMTTQIPRTVHLAIKQGTHQPKTTSPECTFFSNSKKQFEAGIQIQEIQGVKLRVYDPEKTVVDCFKFRNRIGLDIAIEALKAWKQRRGKNTAKLLEYARLCRVEKIIMPYLEALS